MAPPGDGARPASSTASSPRRTWLAASCCGRAVDRSPREAVVSLSRAQLLSSYRAPTGRSGASAASKGEQVAIPQWQRRRTAESVAIATPLSRHARRRRSDPRGATHHDRRHGSRPFSRARPPDPDEEEHLLHIQTDRRCLRGGGGDRGPAPRRPPPDAKPSPLLLLICSRCAPMGPYTRGILIRNCYTRRSGGGAPYYSAGQPPSCVGRTDMYLRHAVDIRQTRLLTAEVTNGSTATWRGARPCRSWPFDSPPIAATTRSYRSSSRRGNRRRGDRSVEDMKVFAAPPRSDDRCR